MPRQLAGGVIDLFQADADNQECLMQKELILVVDDEIQILNVIERIFQNSNFEIIKAEGGLKALEILEKEKVDLLLTDIGDRYVVAVGSCACTGMPSATRNIFTPEHITKKIADYMSRFDYSSKVRKLEEVIKVDDKVEGCPMKTEAFLEVLDKYLKTCLRRQVFGVTRDA